MYKKIFNMGRAISRSLFCQYEHNFNTPITFDSRRHWNINERIVEFMFAFNSISLHGKGKSVFELGPTRSHFSLSLASTGYQVTAVDLREYKFTHPNLKVHTGDLVKLNIETKYDYVVAISVLEHVGIGAYGDDRSDTKLRNVVNKLVDILKDDGKLIVTVPFGIPHRTNFQRVFSYGDIGDTFGDLPLSLVDEYYYIRSAENAWGPATRESASQVHSDRSVNCVACLAWVKQK